MTEGGASTATRLAALIGAHGPISVAHFMALALGDRQGGVYAKPAIGAGGHFTTAPEISQIFGELLGLCLVQTWLDQGSPASFVLAEAGPGRGTLMVDALRAARVRPDFLAAAELHLIETSAALRAVQAGRLAEKEPRFHDDIATLPADRPLYLIANEFLDALPIRQFVRHSDGWHERLVGLDADGRFAFTAGPPVPHPTVRDDVDFLEAAPAREAWVQAVAGRIADKGGLALLIDYGDDCLAGETLQAVRHHRHADPLENPGEADLSSHVAFAPLARVASAAGCHAYGPVPQGRFLNTLGGAQRLARLQQGRPPDEAAALQEGWHRLTQPEQMGLLFKAMALTPEDAPAPPGFMPDPEAAVGGTAA